ncbi:hypothetical protein MIMGU_mgv1a020662mg [Erythranthe guttata]|uniref:Ubiquitin-like domain-containing protein n=1 Tax=Erythranthe guttata TaxID=4155 RepID=A0A022R1T6_ERYGU|nr:hypothetical protein MIMGU_mgv1a020662mg [Erythranthe guttata]
MKLVAELLTGSLFYVEVKEDDTVGDLKREIGDQENLPTDRLIFILDDFYNNRTLMDNNETPLKDYGVRDSSHIYIFFEPADDIDSPTSCPKDSASNEPSSPNAAVT